MARDDDQDGLRQPLVSPSADVESDTLPEPEDKAGRVYAIFYILGVGQMLPWNVFINATSYFQTRFNGSPFADNFENFFSIAFNICNVLGVIFASKYQGLIAPRTRVIVPLVGNALVFLVTTALVLVTWKDDASPMFYITIAICVMAGCFVAMLQSGIFGLAAQFPMQYAQAIMGGQGMAGMSVALVFMLTTWAQPGDGMNNTYDDEKWSSFVYFGIASAFVLLCTFAYFALEKSEYAQYFANFVDIKPDVRASTNVKTFPMKEVEKSQVAMSPAMKRAASKRQQKEDGNSGPSVGEMRRIYAQIAPSAWAVFGVFFITLGIFPSLTVHIAPSTTSTNVFFTKLWVPFSFLNFNLCDFVGRTLAGKGTFLKSPSALLAASVARVAFVPLFMFCKREEGFHDSWPTVFDHFIFPIVFMMLFALSNGYVSTRCMMIGPAKVPLEQQEVAGAMMVVFLVTGLALGSTASFGFS